VLAKIPGGPAGVKGISLFVVPKLLVDADGRLGEWDEFRSEQLLRQSDMTGEKYRRLLEQYGHGPEAERIIAREMGWTWVEEALDELASETPEEQAARQAEIDAMNEDAANYVEPEPDPATEGIDWVRDDEERIVHPIYKRARDAQYGVMDDLKVQSRMPGIDDEPVEEFFAEICLLAAKLAGALNGLARDSYRDPAMIIANLKRILEIHNRALTTLEAAKSSPLLSAERQTQTRTELFTLREEILALITRLRK
jgi:hypothetical protein